MAKETFDDKSTIAAAGRGQPVCGLSDLFGQRSGQGGGEGPVADDFGAPGYIRWRIAPLVVFSPSEFSRLRLQYNIDDADHLDEVAHSVWLGLEVLIGAHPAHSF
jgi:hypothetical protein